MFGCEAIIDRNDRHVELARGLCAIRAVNIEIADHKAAAMIEDHDRACTAVFPRII
jgi:hypothetical protein